MALRETPLQTVKRVHGGKDKLVEAVVKALKAIGEEVDGDDEQDLATAANKRLLRLHSIATTVGERYGDKDKLITALATAVGKPKDEDFVASLGSLSLGQLLDQATSAEARARRVSKKAAA